MIDINKLPDEWRDESKDAVKQDELNRMYSAALNQAATELRSALPKWTRITDDPSTFPAPNKPIMTTSVLCDGEWSEQHIFTPISTHWMYDIDHVARDRLIGTYWRPLCSIDYPPEST